MILTTVSSGRLFFLSQKLLAARRGVFVARKVLEYSTSRVLVHQL